MNMKKQVGLLHQTIRSEKKIKFHVVQQLTDQSTYPVLYLLNVDGIGLMKARILMPDERIADFKYSNYLYGEDGFFVLCEPRLEKIIK